MTLLKNTGNTLPLSAERIAVVGPNAAATTTMQARAQRGAISCRVGVGRPRGMGGQGNYYGNAPYLIAPTVGLGKFAAVTYVQGCDIGTNDTSGIAAAAAAAAAADATVIIVGLDQNQESEGHDRTSLLLPGAQEALVAQVAAAGAAGGRPVVVVVRRAAAPRAVCVWGGGVRVGRGAPAADGGRPR